MEVIFLKSGKRIEILEADFDTMSNAWGIMDTTKRSEAIGDLTCHLGEDKKLSKKYSKEAINAAFDIHAEYNGITVENELEAYSKKKGVTKVKQILEDFINSPEKSKQRITKKQAKEILKSFRSLEDKILTAPRY